MLFFIDTNISNIVATNTWMSAGDTLISVCTQSVLLCTRCVDAFAALGASPAHKIGDCAMSEKTSSVEAALVVSVLLQTATVTVFKPSSGLSINLTPNHDSIQKEYPQEGSAAAYADYWKHQSLLGEALGTVCISGFGLQLHRW